MDALWLAVPFLIVLLIGVIVWPLQTSEEVRK